MKPTFAAASLAALATVFACSDASGPIAQDLVDEAFAVSVSGAGVDPNAETAGGHSATLPAVTCAYNATTKWVTCGPSTQNGLAVTREMQFLDSSGTPQPLPGTATRSMKSKTTVAGTLTIKTTAVTGTTTVSRTSEETVTGLGPTSTQRVINGTGSGTEDSEGTDTRGSMTVKRVYADTTTGMTFAAVFSPMMPWPTAGKIVRNVTASVLINGAAAKDYSSREEQTFSAGGKVTMTITMNGQTRTCVMQLGSKTLPVCT